MLLIICYILAISTVGFGLLSYLLLKKGGALVKAQAEIIIKMATLIEVQTINDLTKYNPDKKELSFQVMEAFENFRQYYKKVPPHISLMLKALREKYGERGEKPHGITIHT